MKEIRSYFKTGELRSIEPRNEKGLRHGVFKMFYPSGEIDMIATYVHGVLWGRIAAFTINGKIVYDDYSYDNESEGERLME